MKLVLWVWLTLLSECVKLSVINHPEQSHTLENTGRSNPRGLASSSGSIQRDSKRHVSLILPVKTTPIDVLNNYARVELCRRTHTAAFVPHHGLKMTEQGFNAGSVNTISTEPA
ncbi:hypothetical protein Pst134EB_023757 [Puccinia striiformis f. sp. tritici]|nr:hypothetical protein Pst134EB_023757 [Puccinia striiformis f. sp. tritici]